MGAPAAVVPDLGVAAQRSGTGGLPTPFGLRQLGGPDWSRAFVAAYLAEGVLHEAEVDRALEPMLRLRWAVQADYFAQRIAKNDLTGIAGPHENLVGLEDSRRGLGV